MKSKIYFTYFICYYFISEDVLNNKHDGDTKNIFQNIEFTKQSSNPKLETAYAVLFILYSQTGNSVISQGSFCKYVEWII